uniref:Uncharacterized protein n=1 Tax=Erythrolobus madagascarensis TaxID=708628 RepID=A0A7S0T7U8_9RHOD|mmetsp:Transcript_4312/g.9375  ORF Transcript_4312/g.9375 Transcript_4312/m.9375 type:complete len:133 (+) Transcript_4312:67-465(+)
MLAFVALISLHSGVSRGPVLGNESRVIGKERSFRDAPCTCMNMSPSDREDLSQNVGDRRVLFFSTLASIDSPHGRSQNRKHQTFPANNAQQELVFEPPPDDSLPSVDSILDVFDGQPILNNRPRHRKPRSHS